MSKILFVINHAGFFLSHRLPLALAARAAGHDVHIATPRSKHVPQIESAGLTWHPIHLSRSGRNPLGEVRTLLSLTRLYRQLKPDLVHQVTSKPVVWGTMAARRAGVPAVVNAISGLGHVFTDHSSADRLLRAVLGLGYRFALRHAKMRVIFQNEADRSFFIDNGWLRKDRSVLIPGSGVDPDVFKPSTTRYNAVPVVVFPSRMLLTKGLVEFVDAARMLRARGVVARFVLVGDPDPDNLASVSEEEIAHWVAEGVVEYWGRREDMPAVLAQADIACLPSYREGLPKALLEAASAALPIVTTDVPGCCSVVADGDNGFLVPVRDSARLAEALEALIVDPALRARMGQRGRDRVLEQFSLERIIGAILQLYRELLA